MTSLTYAEPSNCLADDIHAGADAIARLTGKTLRQTNYLLETGQLPAFKIGRIWHMRRSTFLQFIEQQEAASRIITTN